ncbi:MAG: ribosome silencing factor [Candidatus Kapaibacterium sp.]
MAKKHTPADAKSLATYCAKLAKDKKATTVTLLNIKEIDGSPAEWFVVAECMTEPQVRSMAEEMVAKTKALGMDAPRTEGWDSMNWVILDFFDVVVHIMKKEARQFYKLEKLWGDAEMFTISEAGRVVKAKGKDIMQSLSDTEGSDD